MTNFLRYKTLLLGQKRFGCFKVLKIALCVCWAWLSFLTTFLMCHFSLQKVDELWIITIKYIHEAQKNWDVLDFLFWNFWHFAPHVIGYAAALEFTAQRWGLSLNVMFFFGNQSLIAWNFEDSWKTGTFSIIHLKELISNCLDLGGKSQGTCLGSAMAFWKCYFFLKQDL